MPEKRKRGRPSVPKAAFKGEYVVCRMVKAEVAEIEAAAARANQAKSAWVRQALLSAARQAPPQA